MKKIIVSLIILISINKSYSQCINLTDLLLLTSQDLEKQDNFLLKKGFELTDGKMNLDKPAVEWHNEKFGTYVTIKTLNNKFDFLRYRLGSDVKCYDDIVAQVTAKLFKKDYIGNDEYNALYYFYSNNTIGIIFTKWKAEKGHKGYFYSFEILTKVKYLKELANRKK